MQTVKRIISNFLFPASGKKHFKPTKFTTRSTNSDIFDGWDVFMQDAVTQLQRKRGAFNYIPEQQAIQYEIDIRKTIGGEIYRRTGIHPDLNTIKQLEVEASGHIDYPRQLAYLVYRYEDSLVQQNKTNTTNNTLAEMTAELT